MKGNLKYAVVLLFFISTCLIQGQTAYSYYENLVNDKVNDNKTALTYFITKDGSNVLRFVNLENRKEVNFQDITGQTVLTNNDFIGYGYLKKTLFKMNIKTMNIDTIPNVDSYEWIEPFQALVYHQSSEQKLKIVGIRDNNTAQFDNVTHYVFNESKTKVVVRNKKQQLIIFDFKTGEAVYYKLNNLESQQMIKKIIWNYEDNLPLLLLNDSIKFYIHTPSKNGTDLIFSAELRDLGRNTIVDTLFSRVQAMSGKRIALPVKMLSDHKIENEPEIWLGKTVGLTPYLKQQLYKGVQLGIADLNMGKFLNLAQSDKVLNFGVTSDGRRVLAYENKDDDSKSVPDKLLYLYSDDLSEKILVSKTSGIKEVFCGFLMPSYLFYMKNNDWKWFDDTTGKLKNLTGPSGGFFYKENETFHLKQYDVVAQNLLAVKNRYIIFYDLYDIYLYDIEKSTYTNLTKGNTNSDTYRFAYSNFVSKSKAWSLMSFQTFRNLNSWILHWNTKDYTSEGLAILDKNFKVRQLVSDNASYSQIYHSSTAVTYLKEKANMPPSLFLFDLKTGKESIIYQSNKHDTIGENLKTEFVSWVNDDGNNQNVIIRYPLNYDKSKKYPAIVYIYEDKGKEQHFYQSPFKNSDVGFNYRHYIENGYFVIEPDIYYKYGEPGASALNCVVTALNKVYERCAVDRDNLGIIGHSFGGYETNMIISKSDIFKAAVSGAGISDITNWYLSVGAGTKKPEMWRYPKQSFRMKKKLFEIKDMYLENSPVLISQNCNTPLLLWSGMRDNNVDYKQTISMFLALKDQGKSVNMILYPKEDHGLIRKENQLDLQKKIKQWFDYHLQVGEEPDWIKEGLQ